MKNLFSVAALCMLLFPLGGFSQTKVDKKNLPFNNYDNKYYFQGKPFSGIMVSGNNEIAFQNGEVNGWVTSHDATGKVFRKLFYTNGEFTGEFFTESYKGTFREDTIIGLFTGYHEGGKIKSFEYDFRYTNNQPGYSYDYDTKGRLTAKGIIYASANEYFYTAFGLVIRIDDFIEGWDFTRLRSFPNFIGFNTEYMHHLTKFNSETGKPLFQQVFRGDSLIGELHYHKNGRIKDSIIFLEPLDVIAAFEENTLKAGLEYIEKNRQHFSYSEKGIQLEKSTRKLIQPESEEEEIKFPESRYINALQTQLENGTIEYDWNFNELGKLEGAYITNYTNGTPKIKASFSDDYFTGYLHYYRLNGKRRFSLTEANNGEWLFEEFLPDGFLKIKKTLSEKEVTAATKKIKSRLRIGIRTSESELIGEDDNLIEDFFSADEEEEQQP